MLALLYLWVELFSLSKNSYSSSRFNGLENVRIKDYKSSVCKGHLSFGFDEFIGPFSNYTCAIKYWGLKLSEIGEESYEKKFELFKQYLALNYKINSIWPSK